jgi:hypothetical protein
MATRHRKGAPRQPEALTASATPVTQWTWLLFRPLLEAQRLQWDAYLGWQQAVATFHKDIWEQWAVRYGGGVPIDG